MDEGLFANRPPSVDLVVLLDQKSDISIRLNIKIRSQNHDGLQWIANDGLSSLLSTQNYHVQSEEENSADKAHYILDLTGTVVKYPGFNGMQFSKISGAIQVRSGKTKRVLKTIKIDAEATKAGALTHADAAEKAIGLMIDVISEDLLSTLEKNLGRN